MALSSQRKAVAKNRLVLKKRGISRFEVRAPDADKELIRSLARQLVARNKRAAKLRAALIAELAADDEQRGGILAALRRSPLVGVDLDLERDHGPGRPVDL